MVSVISLAERTYKMGKVHVLFKGVKTGKQAVESIVEVTSGGDQTALQTISVAWEKRFYEEVDDCFFTSKELARCIRPRLRPWRRRSVSR